MNVNFEKQLYVQKISQLQLKKYIVNIFIILLALCRLLINNLNIINAKKTFILIAFFVETAFVNNK